MALFLVVVRPAEAKFEGIEVNRPEPHCPQR